MYDQFYAHSHSDLSEDQWQHLETHLRNVAGLAAGFAEPLGAAGWAYLAGLWHDLGKYSREFQTRLRGKASKEVTISNCWRTL